jgi:hypothetical protein
VSSRKKRIIGKVSVFPLKNSLSVVKEITVPSPFSQGGGPILLEESLMITRRGYSDMLSPPVSTQPAA